MARLLFGLTLVILCAVSASAEEDKAQLREASKVWEQAFNAGDAEALAAVYATDAMLLPPNAAFVDGRKAITEFWAGFVTTAKGKLHIKEVSVQGDLAYILGTFELFGDDGEMVGAGKYIEIWNREGGDWQLYRDIWNASPSQPKPEK